MNTEIVYDPLSELPENSQVILYDGICVFCNKAIMFIARNDRQRVFYYVHLQSDFAAKLIKSEQNQSKALASIFLYDGKNLYSSSTAVLKISKSLKWPYPILYGLMILPVFFRDWVYGIIAKNRYRWFGKYDECTIPDETLKERFLGNDLHVV